MGERCEIYLRRRWNEEDYKVVELRTSDKKAKVKVKDLGIIQRMKPNLP